MKSFFYAINIGTLATWLTLSVFGIVGGAIPFGHTEVPKLKQLEALPVEQELTLESEEPSGAEPLTEAEVSTQESSLPAPPELPPIAEFEPLPEIPELPVLNPAPSPKKVNSEFASKVSLTSKNSKAGAPSKRASSQAVGKNSAQSNSLRFAAGRMKKPNYPYQARINKQSGTVIVEFIVNTDGNVISAIVIQSSNWPLLDNEALRAIRNWKFPPGSIMKFRKPITFQFK